MFGHHDVADIRRRTQQSDAADQVLLRALFDVAATGIRIAALQRGKNVLHVQPVRPEPGQVRHHLVLLDEAAAAHNIRHSGNNLQLPLHHPVLDAAQLRGADGVALQVVAEDLADRTGQGAQRGLDAVGEVGVLQPLLHLLSRKVVVDGIVKRNVDERQAELGV